MVLRPYFARALPVDARAVLYPPADDATAECVDVLGKFDVWPVSRTCTTLVARAVQNALHHGCAQK